MIRLLILLTAILRGCQSTPAWLPEADFNREWPAHEMDNPWADPCKPDRPFITPEGKILPWDIREAEPPEEYLNFVADPGRVWRL
jgi:hypothetical protein